MRRVLVAVVVAVMAAPVVALAQDLPTRLPGEQKVIGNLIVLPHNRLIEVLEKLGIKPDGGFLNCLCASAGYGSSSTSQFYHPDTLGDYNPTYSCTQPGPPCVVSGMGCYRNPLPHDSTIWERCALSTRPEGGTSVLDAVLAGVAKRGSLPAPDYLKDLAKCKANWANQLDTRHALAPYQGYEYLAANGAPVLPPPPKLAAALKAEADRAGATVRERLRKAEAAAAEGVKTALARQMAEAIITEKDNYASAAALAMAVSDAAWLGYRNDAEKRAGDLRAAMAKLPEGPERNAAFHEVEAEMNGIEVRRAEYTRDQKHLSEFIAAVNLAKDFDSLNAHYQAITGADPRAAAGAIHGTTEIVQKYLDLYRDHRGEITGELADIAAKSGLTPAQDKLLVRMSANNELLDGASQAMGETLKAGSWAMQTYDGYQVFQAQLAEVDRLAAKGNYTDAQARLLAAFNAISALTQTAGQYLPPGISDLVGFYGEAMKTPAAMDQIMREIVNRSDEHAEVTGDQAKTPAMVAYQDGHGGVSLQRDDYLYRQAGLQAYRMDNSSDPAPYVLIPDASGSPIYLTQKNYDKLAQMAYYYPLAEGRRMNDADVLAAFGNVGAKGTITLDDLRHKAEANLTSAAADKRIADMFGQKTFTAEESSLWSQFRALMTDALPPACVLDATTQKALFGYFREPTRRGEVTRYLSERGAALKAAAATGGTP
ncbi:MAG: hypothetical protein Q8Q26_11235 [Pseudorhodobacter sp.]|nr:hypothetical protein [Pseudorhodobacter sp.]